MLKQYKTKKFPAITVSNSWYFFLHSDQMHFAHVLPHDAMCCAQWNNQFEFIPWSKETTKVHKVLKLASDPCWKFSVVGIWTKADLAWNAFTLIWHLTVSRHSDLTFQIRLRSRIENCLVGFKPTQEPTVKALPFNSSFFSSPEIKLK